MIVDEALRQLVKAAVREALAEAGALQPNSHPIPSMIERACYSKREFAVRHAVSARALDYWLRSGAVKSIKQGQRVYVPAAESDRLLREGLPTVPKSRRRASVQVALA